jgi:selenocysteine-specific elongation factor
VKNFILATAGHVDHGKTAVIKALTGTDTDRLPEEKKRGITIELGFAHLELEGNSIGIVDVPGHEDFVKNMVGGVGSIDLALLVVAADDGWMPQTEEHLQILTYLGVSRAVVALTKSDLSASLDTVEAEIRTQLSDSPFAAAPIIRTSVTHGRGIEELKTTLASEFSLIAPQPDVGKPRLAVDRAFALRGIGTVVTGTLIGGELHKGDAIVVQPTALPGRIRAIQNHNRGVDEIGPGSRTALNLPDLSVASDRGQSGVWRGDVITLTQLGEASDVVDVLLTRSPRLGARTRPIKHGAIIRVHHGSGHRPARVFLQTGAGLGPGGSEIAQLRFDHPVFMFAADRFVLRDSSEQATLAGGVVLDPEGGAQSFRSVEQLKFLAERGRAPGSLAVFVRTQIMRDRVTRRAELLIKSPWNSEQIAAVISELTKTGAALERGDLVVDAPWWSDVRARAILAIDREHASHPDRTGLELVRLRNSLGMELRCAETLSALVEDLCADGFMRSGEVIHRASHRPSAPPSLQPAVARIRAALAGKPFDPPSRKELAPDATSQGALWFLRETKELLEIGPDLLLNRETEGEMRRIVSDFIRVKGAASVSDLRQALGSSRRVVVPLLEHFDRAGVTRRVGDKRVLASGR